MFYETNHSYNINIFAAYFRLILFQLHHDKFCTTCSFIFEPAESAKTGAAVQRFKPASIYRMGDKSLGAHDRTRPGPALSTLLSTWEHWFYLENAKLLAHRDNNKR